jgi:F0F1-type ATP synthase assembly protein I
MGVVYVIIALGIGFVAGALVWRKNAKKLGELEAKAKAKGKELTDLVK